MRELVGKVLGWASAPVIGAVAAVRRKRFFHPDGIVVSASVEPVDAGRRFRLVADRLEGPALARLSSALWRAPEERTDALGLAIRFRSSDAVTPLPSAGDQDVLFATIKHPWTMPFAPLTTDVHDFLANDYFAVSPFFVDGFGRAKLRVKHPLERASAATREERLRASIDRGMAVLGLEMRHIPGGPWVRIADVRLRAIVDVDQEALRFSPFRAGRGIHPRGLVHAMRPGAYTASQIARPAHG